MRGPADSSLEETRAKIERLRARQELRALEMNDRLMEGLYWSYTGDQFGDFVDPHDAYRDDSYGGLRITPFGGGGRDSRRDGGNRPFVWAEIDLDFQREQARSIATRNLLAAGAVESLADYTAKTGYTYEVRPAPAYRQDATAKALARIGQQVLDEFCSFDLSERGRERFVWADREWQSVADCVVDGEVFLRLFDQQDGTCLVRPVMPEQIRQPYGSGTDYLHGIRHAPGDVESHEEYAVTYDQSPDWEPVPASEMVHLAANVPSTVKRGLSDLYPGNEFFAATLKLVRNMIVTDGVRSAVAWIEQYEQAGASALQSLVEARRDRSRPQYQDPLTGRTVDRQRIEAGSVPLVGAGREYVQQPSAANAQSFVTTAQAGMRALGARWKMPEYVISGDASNANLASLFAAGGPFVTRIECRQAVFGRRLFVVVMWKGPIAAACRARRFRHGGHVYSLVELSRMLDVKATPPQVAMTDADKERSEDRQDVEKKLMSVQTYRARRGLDDEVEEKNLKERPADDGQGGGGAPPPDAGPPAPPPDAASPEEAAEEAPPEEEDAPPDVGGLEALLGGRVRPMALCDEERSLVESLLSEAGFTGEKKVTVGGKEQTWHYRDGKRVSAPGKAEGGAKKPKAKKESPAQKKGGKEAKPKGKKGKEDAAKAEAMRRIEAASKKEATDPNHPLNKYADRVSDADFGSGNVATVRPTKDAPLSKGEHEALDRAHSLVAKALQLQGDEEGAKAQLSAAQYHRGIAAKKPEAAPKAPEQQRKGLSEAGQKLHALTESDLSGAKFARPSGMGDSKNAPAVGVVNVGGQKAFYKGVGKKAAQAEGAVADLAGIAGVRSPAVRHGEIPGAPAGEGGGGIIAEWIEGPTVADLLEADDADFERDVESKLRPGELDRMALFSFLTNLPDVHQGNFMVEGDRLVTIDHEGALWGETKEDDHGAGPTAARYVLRMRDGDPRAASFHPEALAEVAAASDAMAARLESHDPKSAARVRKHGAVLKKLAAGNDRSYRRLEQLTKEEFSSGGGK